MQHLLEFFTPQNYQLILNVNKHSELVQGRVIISGTPKTAKIQFHAQNLKISSVTTGQSSANFILDSPSVAKFSHRADLLEIEELNPGQPVFIEIKYSFRLNHNMEGAYLSTYQHQNQEQRIVATQFESHYARQCFPCIDEPAAKATFDLKIIIPDEKDAVLANTPALSSRTVVYDSVDENFTLGKKATKKITIFETTPRMSTYLLAFCIGEFHQKSTKNAHGVEITSYCALNQAPGLLDFPNHIASASLDYYDELFDTKYPLLKLDQVALPDFEAGAMENWGLVTYRESCMLADRKSSPETREYVALVVAHELSHQWFGNLVTMQWWDDLWLNESFATVIEHLAVDHIHPEYQVWQNFFTGMCYAALRRDALQGVQSVKQPVSDPDEIATLFDGAIVYAKGARLMLMLMRAMGEQQFFSGIKDYFQKFAYQNTIGDDLWQSLQPYADFNVKDFMHAWLAQPGFPVLSGDQQQRFLLDGSTDQSNWPLPQASDDMSGHYIINLSAAEFQQFLHNFSNLTSEQRIRLLLDRQLLAKTPSVPSADLLKLVFQFQDETSEPIWGIIASIIADLKLFIEPESPAEQNFKQRISGLIAPQLQRLGLVAQKDESANDAKLRPLLMNLAIYAGDPASLTQISALCPENLADYPVLPAETRHAILLAHFKTHQESTFSRLLSDYQTVADPELKSDLLSILCAVKQPENLPKAIALLEQPETVRPQDHLYCYSYLLRNYKTRSQAINWLYEHWDYVKNLTGDKTLGDYIRILAGQIRTASECEIFETFFRPLSVQPSLARAIQTALADIDARLKLIEQDRAAILAELQ